MRILIFICLLISLPLQAQNRYALVMGNGLYEPSLPLKAEPNLPNPRNDAKAIARQLRSLGFQVREAYDQTLNQMDNSIERFTNQLSPGDIALFYYAGHALEVQKTNWLIPVQTNITKTTLRTRSISVQEVLLNMENATQGDKKHGLNLLLLDACRVNPFRSLRLRNGRRGGLRGMTPNVKGSLISFAAAEGEPALDGDGKHSPYAAALLDVMQQQSGLSIYNLFQKVGLKVIATGGQEPWLRSSISGGDFCLHPKGCAKQHWQGLMRSGSPTQAQLLAFLQDYPHSEQAATAKVLLDALAGNAAASRVSAQRDTDDGRSAPTAAQSADSLMQHGVLAREEPDYSAQLRTCAAHLQANRLTRGNSGNALDCYKDVLRQDAGNAEALRGLAAVENTFVKLIEDKIKAGDLSRAQTYIERLQSLNEKHQDLTRLWQKLKVVSTNSKRIAVAGRIYIAYANGTALDTKTGLLWMRCSVGQTWRYNTCTGIEKDFNWEDAKKQTANFAGYSDWRIPTIEELRTLVYCRNGKPTYFNNGKPGVEEWIAQNRPDNIDLGCQGSTEHGTFTIAQSVFPYPSLYSWSGSPHASNSNYAWHITFAWGHDDYFPRDDSNNSVRLVRGELRAAR